MDRNRYEILEFCQTSRGRGIGMNKLEAASNLKMILDEATETEEAVCYVTSNDAETLKLAIEAIEKWNLVDQYKWERDVVLEQLKEIGCVFGQNMEKEKKATNGLVTLIVILSVLLVVALSGTAYFYMKSSENTNGRNGGNNKESVVTDKGSKNNNNDSV